MPFKASDAQAARTKLRPCSKMTTGCYLGLLLMNAAWPGALTCCLLRTRQHAGRQVQVQQALDASPTTRQAPSNLLPCSSKSKDRVRRQPAPLLASKHRRYGSRPDMGCLAGATWFTCPAKDHCCGKSTFHVFKAVQQLLSHADLHSRGVSNQDE